MAAAVVVGAVVLMVFVWLVLSPANEHDDENAPPSLPKRVTQNQRTKTGAGSTTAVMTGTQSLWDDIPADVRNLLFVSSDTPPTRSPGLTFTISIDIENGNVSAEKDEPEDPSTIYLKSEIHIPDSADTVPRPSYSPSYAALSPWQKWYYLRWLANVDSPVDIGFVFIYYYGLERRLLTGDFDAAFDMILRLRRSHDNPSFQGYSSAALVYATVFRNRPDRLKDTLSLLDQPQWGSEQLLVCARLGIELNAANVASVVASISNLNRRYLKNNPAEYEGSVAECLVERYGKSALNLEAEFPFLSLKRRPKILFANYVLPESVRSPEVPDYLGDPDFAATLSQLHKSAHGLTKTRLRARRGGATT